MYQNIKSVGWGPDPYENLYEKFQVPDPLAPVTLPTSKYMTFDSDSGMRGSLVAIRHPGRDKERL